MMKFLRHLLSHIMFFFLITGIVAIYYFRSQVMPDEYVQVIEHYAEKIHPVVLAFKDSEKEIVVSRVQVPSPANVIIEKKTDSDVKVAEQVVEKSVAMPDEANKTEVEPVVEKAAVVERETEVFVKESMVSPLNVVSLKTEQSVNAERVADVPAPDVEEKINAVEVAVAVKQKVTIETVKTAVEKSSDVASADYKLMLQTARSLFQSKKYKESISKYKELIELENHEADFYGELGNVYYGAGSWHMAGEAYYEAAVRLMDKGDYSQVSYLQRVLQGLDKDRAYKLAQKISEKNQEK